MRRNGLRGGRWFRRSPFGWKTHNVRSFEGSKILPAILQAKTFTVCCFAIKIIIIMHCDSNKTLIKSTSSTTCCTTRPKRSASLDSFLPASQHNASFVSACTILERDLAPLQNKIPTPAGASSAVQHCNERPGTSTKAKQCGAILSITTPIIGSFFSAERKGTHAGKGFKCVCRVGGNFPI